MKKMTWSDFFAFRQMVSSSLMRFLYAGGFIIITLASIGMLFEKKTIFVAPLLFVFGNLLWRIIYEGAVIMFSIHERLLSIEELLKKQTKA